MRADLETAYLRSSTADFADVTVMQLRLLGGPFRSLQLALMKRRLLVGVSGWSRHHVAARVTPGGAGQLLGRLLDGRLRLLRLLRLLRWTLGESLLGWLVIGGGGCRGVAG